ncbi:MAG: TIGR00282 family metallophosphoesterase [Brevinematales bacterium]|nr:TIGR00282 family metallophosphoesterase [Brevinematales bacterium]
MKPEGILRILAFGDIIGEPGRKVFANSIHKMREKYLPDLIILNGENSAHGFGITEEIVKSFFNMGVDVITSGNHIWQKKEIFNFIDKYPNLIRPINYPPGTPGSGMTIIEKSNTKIAIINAMGRIFMDAIDCPFRTVESQLNYLKENNVKIILVDFHAEATSEKQVFGWYFDGRVTAVWGTHTHIQTSDERILPKGTAYITDIGMCGARDSVIGMKIEESYRKVIQHLPVKFSPADSSANIIEGVAIDIQVNSGKATLISRIREIISINSK